ncbi:hypothetical protein ACS0TY_023451 [Phlomoides rotata]
MSIISSIILLHLIILSSTFTPIIISHSDSCYLHQYAAHVDQRFEQKNKRFWEFNDQSHTWVEVKLPYNLLSCINNNCTVVNSIKEAEKKREDEGDNRSCYQILPARKRVSVTKLSETSIWVTGESGSIYERFWNGLQWVIAPHDLPLSAGYAVSVFFVNQSILALSEGGLLYQMHLNEDSQPIWVEFKPESRETVQLSFGLVSNDRERMYFGTKKGLLLELLGIDPPRWENHGRPPGANVSAITDAATIRQGLLLIVSGAGDLYEYHRASKPPWKKHIHGEETKKHTRLAASSSSKACTLHGLVGPHSVSLFLLTKAGELIERRLHRRKWNWVVHGKPQGHQLSSITCPFTNDGSLLFTTVSGFVFEYVDSEDVEERWVNHKHPPHAKAARGVAGVSLQEGRRIFALDDGRLSELHLSGRRKYVWSLIDAPETEGWNAEYCTDERGPLNCILGTKEETSQVSSVWRKDSRTQVNYLLSSDGAPTLSDYNATLDRTLFRLRLMQASKSFFLITDNDLTFEYLNTENNGWFWLRHQHSTGIQGAIGNYNGSLFVVDEHGSLLIRERSGSDLAWINCTAMRKGRHVIGGSPWDGIPGLPLRAKPEDAIFLVSTTGRLLQFTVVLRKFKWKDCKNPPGIKIASIVDQEGFRNNIVFVTGENGRLYQYNKVTHLWHQHYQSQHLVLSTSLGTAMRSSVRTLRGSLFMLSEDGGLVEYQWSPMEGWNWIEHGSPHTNVTLVGAPGPCFGGSQLFLIGSDGSVYLRYLDLGEWKWSNCGFPYDGNTGCSDKDFGDDDIKRKSHVDKYCNPKISPTRSIPFEEDSVIFELQDGRLGEMKRMEDKKWIWSRTIGTPTSLCMENPWTSWAT